MFKPREKDPYAHQGEEGGGKKASPGAGGTGDGQLQALPG